MSDNSIVSSVCIATFNGQNYIHQQLSSILNQIGPYDEVIIVDDCSTDNTLDLIREVQDSRVKIFTNEKNRGVIYTFSKAMILSKGSIIFFSDQDDVWVDGHYDKLLNSLISTGKSLVTCNFSLMNKNGMYLGEMKNKLFFIDSTKHYKNIFGIFFGKIDYFGCCMAIKRDLMKYILPVPKIVESHDLWIALIANMLKSNLHLENILLNRRIHGSNLSVVNRPRIKKYMTRIYLLCAFFIIKYRVFTQKIS